MEADTTFTTLQFCYENYNEVPTVMHETLLKLFATYIARGGMPDVVLRLMDTHDIGKVVRASEKYSNL